MMFTFNLKRQWFEKIKSGNKMAEYRTSCKYWDKRISALRIGEVVCFALGYPKKQEFNKRLYAKITAITEDFDGNFSDLEIDEPVWKVEFILLKNSEEE